jgi:hypothetical protein
VKTVPSPSASSATADTASLVIATPATLGAAWPLDPEEKAQKV